MKHLIWLLAIRRSDEGLHNEHRLEKHVINVSRRREGTLLQTAVSLKASILAAAAPSALPCEPPYIVGYT